jgi:hypothetical protein
MNQLGKKDMYSFIMENDLEYKHVGSNLNNIVIGKEIFWDFEFNMFKFNIDQSGIVKIEPKFGESQIILKAEEQLVKSKLLQLGVFNKPEYYVFVNYN